MAVAVTNGGPTIYSITLLWQAHYKRHSKIGRPTSISLLAF